VSKRTYYSVEDKMPRKTDLPAAAAAIKEEVNANAFAWRPISAMEGSHKDPPQRLLNWCMAVRPSSATCVDIVDRLDSATVSAPRTQLWLMQGRCRRPAVASAAAASKRPSATIASCSRCRLTNDLINIHEAGRPGGWSGPPSPADESGAGSEVTCSV